MSAPTTFNMVSARLPIKPIAAYHVFGGNLRLLDTSWPQAQHCTLVLSDVTNGKDGRVARPHVTVDDDTPCDTQTRLGCQFDARDNARSDQQQLGIHRAAIVQQDTS